MRIRFALALALALLLAHGGCRRAPARPDAAAPSRPRAPARAPEAAERGPGAGTLKEVLHAISDDKLPPARAAAAARQAAGRLGAASRRDIARALNTRGHRLYTRKDLDGALPLLEAAAAVDPTYGMPRYNAARIHALRGDLEGCMKYLEALRDLGPGQRRRLRHAVRDPAFKQVRDSLRFKAAQPVDTTALELSAATRAASTSGTLSGAGSARFLVRLRVCTRVRAALDADRGALALRVKPPQPRTSSFTRPTLLALAPAKAPRGEATVTSDGDYTVVVSGAPGTPYRLKVSASGEPGRTYVFPGVRTGPEPDLGLCPQGRIVFETGAIYRYTVIKKTDECWRGGSSEPGEVTLGCSRSTLRVERTGKPSSAADDLRRHVVLYRWIDRVRGGKDYHWLRLEDCDKTYTSCNSFPYVAAE